MKNKDLIIETDIAFGDIDLIEGRMFPQSKRKKMPGSEFIDPERKAFPVLNCSDLHNAISSWGRYTGKLSFSQFKARIKRKAHELGCTLPEKWQQEDKKG